MKTRSFLFTSWPWLSFSFIYKNNTCVYIITCLLYFFYLISMFCIFYCCVLKHNSMNTQKNWAFSYSSFIFFQVRCCWVRQPCWGLEMFIMNKEKTHKKYCVVLYYLNCVIAADSYIPWPSHGCGLEQKIQGFTKKQLPPPTTTKRERGRKNVIEKEESFKVLWSDEGQHYRGGKGSEGRWRSNFKLFIIRSNLLRTWISEICLTQVTADPDCVPRPRFLKVELNGCSHRSW